MSHPDIDMTAPGPRQPPLEIARDTFAIRAVTPSVGGSFTALHAMVIAGPEPVIVDTGMTGSAARWFADVASVVALEEVRWIFITHIDCDHAGNLAEAMARCPQARLVTSRGESYRTAAALGIPFARMEMVDHGQSWRVAGRDLVAWRPPVYDSPYTRGLFDPASGVYYAADAFCAPMPDRPVDWAGEIADGAWADGMARFHHSSLTPWLSLVDPAKFRAEVDALAALGITTIASAHSPPIGREDVARALSIMAGLPGAVAALDRQEASPA